MSRKALYNGTIYTMDKNKPVVSNIVINGSLIEAVDVNMKEYLCAEDEIIDLDGAIVLPGFNDSHMHLLSYGKSLDMVDLNDVTSVEQLIQKARQFISDNKVPKGVWVIGRGWNQDKFSDQRMPTYKDLDKISKEHPIVMTRTCGHIRALNSLCMEQSGMKDRTSIKGGKVFLNSEGKPTGIYAEQGAKEIIYSTKPKLTKEDIKRYVLLAANKFRLAGLTSVHTDDFESESNNESYQLILDAYYELSDDGKLPIKVNHKLQTKKIDKLDELLKQNIIKNYSDFLSIGPLKIEADGSLGARTAAIVGTYHDDCSTSGELNFSYRELHELIDYAYRNHLQVAVHAIGDRMARIYIDIIDKMTKKYGVDLRPRLVHCQITDNDIIKDISRLGIVADVQPIFVSTDWKIAEQRVGKEKAMTSYAWRTLMEQGVIVSGGSDSPVESYKPLSGIECAVTRQDESRLPAGGWNPFEKVTVYDALRMYTYNSAYAEFKEDRKGLIKSGYQADMVILDEDPYLVDNHSISKINIKGTVINGDFTYY